MKDNWKNCSAKPLNKLQHPLQPNMLWFFSEEKNFSLGQMVNSEKNRWLALSPQHVPIVMKTKHLVYFMVFGVVTSSLAKWVDLGSIPGRVTPKTLKMVLGTSLLNTQQYKARIKCKVEQSRERSSALPYT